MIEFVPEDYEVDEECSALLFKRLPTSAGDVLEFPSIRERLTRRSK